MNWLKQKRTYLFIASALLGGYFFFSHNNPKSATENFKCPEDYKTPEEYTKSLEDWMKDGIKNNPEGTVGEMLTERYDQLVAHGCKQTLLNIGRIGSNNTIINFAGKEYGPYVTQTDDDTNVRSVFYPLRGQKTGEAEEEVIFNFYFQNVWGSEPFTTRDLAERFIDSSENGGPHIENKFQAPDPINKEPAFFITSYTTYPEEGYGYVFFIKVASFDKDVYSITFSKKIPGKGKKLQDDIYAWMLENLQVSGTAIGDLGPDDSWPDYFKVPQK